MSSSKRQKKDGAAPVVSSRAQMSNLKKLAAGLENQESVQLETDITEINRLLRGPDKDMVPHIVGLLRSGSLRTAMSLKDASNAAKDGRGAELANTTLTFKLLREEPCRVILTRFEPTIFNAAFWADHKTDFTHKHMQEAIAFGLRTFVTGKLPVFRSSLRYVNVLASYFEIRYNDNGRLLKRFDVNDVKTRSHFVIEGENIKLRSVADGPSIPISAMALANDWAIQKNYSISQASLYSESEDNTINISGRFQKAGVALPFVDEKVDDWDIPESRWPPLMFGSTKGSSTSSASNSRAARPPPPPGNGAAKGEGKGKGKVALDSVSVAVVAATAAPDAAAPAFYDDVVEDDA
jgi:hypothetical protein